MNLNSPLFDRIRTKPSAEAASPEATPRGCDHPGCAQAGTHRAPMGRDHEGQFFHFCLDHVKAYNQTYNYFAGMSDSALQAYLKDAVTGHRPTWTVGVNGQVAAESAIDPGSLLRARMERLRKAREAAAETRKPVVGKAALKALQTLGLDEQADRALVRRRFKELAKRLHPDLNDGDRSREEKLRAIIDAYNYLKSAGIA